MSLNGQDHFHRKSVKRCGFHEADKLPLARSPLRRSRAPSIARCPTRHARARRTGPATVLPALPPRSRLPTPRSPRPGLRRDKARPAAGSRAHHPGPGRPDAACRLLQSPRFSSTTTETDPLTLHAPQRVTPLRGATAGSLTLARERRPSCLESRGQHGLTSTPAPLRTMTRRRALPRTDRPGHLMSQKRARTQPEKPDAEVRDAVPTSPPANSAQSAVRTRARAPLTSAKKIPDRAPEVPFCTMDGPEAGAKSTSCYQPVDGSHDAFYPAACPFRR